VQYDIQKRENIIVQQKLDLVQKNLWFYALFAVLFFAITIALVFFRQYKKRQQLKLQLMQEEEKRNSEKAVMVAEEAERKRIAADLHDSLGAYAASIASNIQQMQETPSTKNSSMMQELKTNSQAIVAQLSDTIWVLKKEALPLTSISDRLKLFIQKLGPSYPSVTIDVCEEIKVDFLLPPAHAFHLFQIIKEAINNALKHSRCTQLVVKIETAEAWKVSITDNGKGMFAEAWVAETGNGLANMQERAKECGWKIEWEEVQPWGTGVMIDA
jgi:signal transduction histidine kinase